MKPPSPCIICAVTSQALKALAVGPSLHTLCAEFLCFQIHLPPLSMLLWAHRIWPRWAAHTGSLIPGQQNGGQKENKVWGIYFPGFFSNNSAEDTVDARLSPQSSPFFFPAFL